MKTIEKFSPAILTGILFLNFCVFYFTEPFYSRNFSDKSIRSSLELLYCILPFVSILLESRFCYGKRNYKKKIANVAIAFAGIVLIALICTWLGWPNEMDFPGISFLVFILFMAFLSFCAVGYYLLSYVFFEYILVSKKEK